MATNVDLLGSYWTLAGAAEPHTDKEYSPFDFKDRVESAARAGFKGIGIWHSDLAHTLKKRSLREMKQIIDDNGIKHIELEFLGGWFLDGEEKRTSDIERKKLLDAADVLRPHHIKVGHFVKTQATMQKMIDAFGALCTDGANHGTLIGFEMMPFCDIDSVEKAIHLVDGAGAKNGGICLDLWHIDKLKIPHQKVATIPRKYITSIEINDGTFECPWSLHEDTINHRQLCGEGEFDVKGFVAVMLKAGYTGPWGIEVLNAELRKKTLEEITSSAYKTTRAQFQ
ncbi:MAG TPA: sugar phosphate isomerase/epimerase family protein [Candidatus Acidoferrales bacterium]|jgi:sugar phosphate isomerase/epimerase|nr:sugar phosphate isomerase/epimerase family protein [Candidatus Acidoferrales bacterium]